MSKLAALAAVVALILVGFFLRLHNLTSQPLRGDEAFSIEYWARYDLARSLTEIATLEPHPLLTYVTFRAWGSLGGTGEFSMRFLPALINLLGVPALYALGCRLGGRSSGVLAALLWTIHPYEIWWAQDARNYGIWAGLSAAALWLGYSAAHRDRRSDWILYSLVATLAANIYYDELFTIAAFALYILIAHRHNRPRIRRAALALVIPVMTPILSFFVLQGSLLSGGGYSGTASNFDLVRLPFFLTALNFGATTLPDTPVTTLWLPLALAVILAITLFLLWQRNRNQSIFLALTAFLPLLILSLVSLRFRIFAPHYVLSTVPAFILIFAIVPFGLYSAISKPQNNLMQKLTLSTKWREDWRPKEVPMGGVMMIVLFPYLLITVFSLHNHYNDPAYSKSADWPAVAHYLEQYIAPDDLVIQLSIDPAFDYYYEAPALDIALPDKPSQPVNEIIAALEQFTANRNAVWLVGQPYPDWPNREVVEAWMRDNWQFVLDTHAGGIHVQQYLPWIVDVNEIDGLTLENFEDTAELVGVQTINPPDTSGDLTIWLYWRAANVTETPLKVFVHLEGAANPATDSPLWTQDDQFPQDGRISTTDWQAGTIYRDIYVLPLASVPPGAYTLRIGFYNPDTNQRIPTPDGDSYTQPITIP